MDFTLDEGPAEVRGLARTLFTELASTDRVRAAEEEPGGVDTGLWAAAARAGLLGIALPESCGGTGLGVDALCALLREQGRAVAPVPLWSASVAALAVAEFGGGARCAALLPGVVEGSLRLALAVEETAPAERGAPGCRAEPRGAPPRSGGRAVASAAVGGQGGTPGGPAAPGAAHGGKSAPGGGKALYAAAGAAPGRDPAPRSADGAPDAPDHPDGTGDWLLTGEKVLVPAPAGTHSVVVSASTDRGTGLFLVPTRGQGVVWEEAVTTAPEPSAHLHLDRAPAHALGPPDGRALLRVLRLASVAMAAFQVGVAEGALALTTTYVSERNQFGRPLGTFQAMQHALADCYIDIEAMDTTLWQAVVALEDGQDTDRAVHVAAWWACQAGMDVVHRTQHAHGGIGVDLDYPLHRYFLWARHTAGALGGAPAALAGLGELLAGGDTP